MIRRPLRSGHVVGDGRGVVIDCPDSKRAVVGERVARIDREQIGGGVVGCAGEAADRDACVHRQASGRSGRSADFGERAYPAPARQLPQPSDVLEFTTTVPLLIEVSPEYVLAVLMVTVLVPFFVKEPGPPMLPVPLIM